MLFGHDEGKNKVQLCDGEKDIVCRQMGGTGIEAETPEELLLALGGAGLVKLWENASATSDFAEQTIETGVENPSEYKYAMAVFNQDSTGRKLISFTKNGYYGEIQHIGNITVSTTTTFRSRRWAWTSTGNLIFSDADQKQGLTSAPTVKNEYLIPIEVYGIKGVQ